MGHFPPTGEVSSNNKYKHILNLSMSLIQLTLAVSKHEKRIGNLSFNKTLYHLL